MSFDIVSTAARKILYAAPGGPKCVVDYKTKITARTPADYTVPHRNAARGSRPADRRWFTFDHDFLAGQVQVNPNMEWLARTVPAGGAPRLPLGNGR